MSTEADVQGTDQTDLLHALEQKKRKALAAIAGESVADVPRALDAADMLSPNEVSALKLRAERMLNQRITDIEEGNRNAAQDLGSKAEEVATAFTELAEEAEGLTERIELDELSLDEASDTHAQLTHALRNLDRRIKGLRQQAEAIRRIADDPHAYNRELEKRYPGIKLTLGGRLDVGR